MQQQSETVLKFYIAQARKGPAEIPKVLTHHFEQKSFFHCCGFAAGLAQSNVGKTINRPCLMVYTTHENGDLGDGLLLF